MSYKLNAIIGMSSACYSKEEYIHSKWLPLFREMFQSLITEILGTEENMQKCVYPVPRKLLL